MQATSYPTTYKIHTDAGVFFDQMSVYDWIEQYVAGGHTSRMGRLLDAAYNDRVRRRDDGPGGAQPHVPARLPGERRATSRSSATSDERFHIAGGNEQLPKAIADYARPAERQARLGDAVDPANADGTVSMAFSTPGKTQTVTADHVILTLPFAVLRTLDYSGAGFDPLKKTAITQLGAGQQREAPAAVQDAATGTALGARTATSTPTSAPERLGRDARAERRHRASSSTTRAATSRGAFKPSTPYSNAAHEPAGRRRTRTRSSARLETLFPGISKQWNGKASLSTPFLDPNLNLSYSYWKPGQYVGFSGYEGVAQGNIHFAGEHCSQDFQGYMEGAAAEGARAAGEVLAAYK